jgi:multidrug efflux pump subunit AcrA (membrane-fusion protein)
MSRKASSSPFVLAFLALCVVVGLVYYSASSRGDSDNHAVKDNSSASDTTVNLTQSQSGTIKVETVGTYHFRTLKNEVGSVAYHEKETSPDAHPGVAAGKFVVANVLESDSPLIRVGQPVEVKAQVYPDRIFTGKVSTLGVSIYDSGGNPAVDPNTHRTTVRCEVDDPHNELYPGMLVAVAIEVEGPTESVAVPENGVVREGDGTMTVWVTSDRRRFDKRIVKTGLRQDGYVQILGSLKEGELVATKNAVFLSNMNNADDDSP